MTDQMFTADATAPARAVVRDPGKTIPDIPTAWMVVGDTREVMAALPAGFADLVLSSPPFQGLREYLPADHPMKPLEIGLEPSPGEYINAMLEVTEAAARSLAEHGSLMFELDDTWTSTGGGKGDYSGGEVRSSQVRWNGSAAKRQRLGIGENTRPPRARSGPGWPLEKSLALIPESYRWALVYGHNPHRTVCPSCRGDGVVTVHIWRTECDDCDGTGMWHRPTAPWRARNVVRWCRPNPQPGWLGDKWRHAVSDMIVACKSETRWFDLDAVRGHHKGTDGNGPEDDGRSGGAPPLDWWEIPVDSYEGAHFAVMNPAVAVRPIKSMCPPAVCRVCGEPRRRLTVPSDEYTAKRGGSGDFSRHSRGNADMREGRAAKSNESGFTAEHVTVGWTDCGCGDPGDGFGQWRRGLVLDPFGGSGTTGMVATGNTRDCVLIDFDERNVALAEKRVGPMFFRHVSVDELCTIIDNRGFHR